MWILLLLDFSCVHAAFSLRASRMFSNNKKEFPSPNQINSITVSVYRDVKWTLKFFEISPHIGLISSFHSFHP